MIGKLLPWLVGGAAAVGLGYMLTHDAKAASAGTTLYKGALAKPGDLVTVPMANLPAGALPPSLPHGIGNVIVQVEAVVGAVLRGAIVGYQFASDLGVMPLTTPIGPLQIPTSAVTSVSRKGQVVA